MYNIGVSLHMYYMYRTCLLHMYMPYIHLYFYTYNTPKTPHMYYRCSTMGHVKYMIMKQYSHVVSPY